MLGFGDGCDEEERNVDLCFQAFDDGVKSGARPRMSQYAVIRSPGYDPSGPSVSCQRLCHMKFGSIALIGCKMLVIIC